MQKEHFIYQIKHKCTLANQNYKHFSVFLKIVKVTAYIIIYILFDTKYSIMPFLATNIEMFIFLLNMLLKQLNKQDW